MGKVILEFDSDTERPEIESAINGYKYKMVLWELDQKLRGLTKHAPDSMSDDTYDAYEHARELLRETLSENNVSLD